MHTTSGVDTVDEFVETVEGDGANRRYRYGSERRPLTVRDIALRVRQPDGSMAERRFRTFATHHGPVTRAENGRWIATALMNRPLAALEQSFLRTKARDLAAFERVSERRANSTNNTLFADGAGATAFLPPQFVPRRDDRFDYSKPVDGSDPATDWRGDHGMAELPRVVSPAGGWLANTNNWPWSVAGAASPAPARFPRYLDQAGENPRGLHAIELLEPARRVTLDGLVRIAFDSRLPAFDLLLPPLLRAFDALPAGDPRRARLAGPAASLRG
jgi:acyl-homoserine-lactone acylase